MVNVSQSLFADRQVITSRYLQEDWQADLSPELLSVLLVEPDKQSLSGLYRFAQFFSEGLIAMFTFSRSGKNCYSRCPRWRWLCSRFPSYSDRCGKDHGLHLVAIGTGLAFTLVQRMMEPVS